MIHAKLGIREFYVSSVIMRMIIVWICFRSVVNALGMGLLYWAWWWYFSVIYLWYPLQLPMCPIKLGGILWSRLYRKLGRKLFILRIIHLVLLRSALCIFRSFIYLNLRIYSFLGLCYLLPVLCVII